VPENVIENWAFETRFVAIRGIVSAFASAGFSLNE
jgi:hypothetical protein